MRKRRRSQSQPRSQVASMDPAPQVPLHGLRTGNNQMLVHEGQSRYHLGRPVKRSRLAPRSSYNLYPKISKDKPMDLKAKFKCQGKNIYPVGGKIPKTLQELPSRKLHIPCSEVMGKSRICRIVGPRNQQRSIQDTHLEEPNLQREIMSQDEQTLK